MDKSKLDQFIELSRTSGASPPNGEASPTLDRTPKEIQDQGLQYSSLKIREWMKTKEVAAGVAPNSTGHFLYDRGSALCSFKSM